MTTRKMMTIALGLALAAPVPASAAVTLLAEGTLSGAVDASGLSYTLENGLPANFLGGVGSGLAYAGGNSFLGIPDRGPNATAYNSLVDDTVSWVARFHSLTMTLTPSAPGSALPFDLGTSLDATTLLWSASALVYGSGAGLGVPAGDWINTPGKNYFSGRSDNYGAGLSTDTSFARLDPEAIRLSPDGKSVFVSDEYGPFVRQFDRATGELIRTFDMPDNLAISNLSPQASVERTGNSVGRYTNSGMEGLAITPDGKTLVGVVQGALQQDRADPAAKNLLRLVTIDIASGTTKQYGYMLTAGSGVSEILAISDTQFLVLERDGKGLGDGSKAKIKQLYVIDIAGATDISNLSGAAAAALAVTKEATPFLDLVAALTAYGIPAELIPSKIEGIAFGQTVNVDGTLMHTLYVSDDNDFLPGTSGPNHFYVFGFTGDDLPGYAPSAVPEPATWAMLLSGFAVVGAAMRRRRLSVRFG
jgi:hypothetical protein